MSTAINITVDDGGLPARNRQQVAANRQALVQKIAREQSTALGLDKRSQDRIAQGRDPATGALLIPPASGGGIPRLNQQPAANRQTTATGIEWSCTFTDPAFDAYYPTVDSSSGNLIYLGAFTCPFRKKGGKSPGLASFLATSTYGTLVQPIQYKRTTINNNTYLEAQVLVIDPSSGSTPSNVGIIGSLSDTPVRKSSDLAYSLLAQRPITKALGKNIDTLSVSISAVIRPPSTANSTVSIAVYLIDKQLSGENKFNDLYRLGGIVSTNALNQSVASIYAGKQGADEGLNLFNVPLDSGIILNTEQFFSLQLRKSNGSHYLSMLIDNAVVLEHQLPFPVSPLDCKPIIDVDVRSESRLFVDSVGPVLCGPITARFT
jgi:hypothetical protein